MIKLLEPDEAFFVDLDEDYKPFLTELKSISFGRQAHHPTMRIPEFVLHSRKLNKYVAVKMVLAREMETYVATFKPAVTAEEEDGGHVVCPGFPRDASLFHGFARRIYRSLRTSMT